MVWQKGSSHFLGQIETNDWKFLCFCFNFWFSSRQVLWYYKCPFLWCLKYCQAFRLRETIEYICKWIIKLINLFKKLSHHRCEIPCLPNNVHSYELLLKTSCITKNKLLDKDVIAFYVSVYLAKSIRPSTKKS